MYHRGGINSCHISSRWRLLLVILPMCGLQSANVLERRTSRHGYYPRYSGVRTTQWPLGDVALIIIYNYTQRSCWGGILVSLRPSVRLSVRPSVRPSVPHAVSALYHLQLWMDSFHIRHKWSLPWEGVSRTMTFDLDLYLQGHLALT